MIFIQKRRQSNGTLPHGSTVAVNRKTVLNREPCGSHSSAVQSQQGKKLRIQPKPAVTVTAYPSHVEKRFQMVPIRFSLEETWFFSKIAQKVDPSIHGHSTPGGRRRCFVVDPPQGVRDHELRPASTSPWWRSVFGIFSNRKAIVPRQIWYR